MLIAHLVPGYAAAVFTRSHWNAEWTCTHRAGLWIAALGSTFAPDLDVIYNIITRGIVNHNVLWTHSLFLHGGIALIWLILRRTKRWHYGQFVVGLVAWGGLSHLALDMIAHNTPIFYPLSLRMIGIAPQSIVEGGFRAYLTHPLILVELALIVVMVAHAANQTLRTNN
jgi:hypothetical protein